MVQACEEEDWLKKCTKMYVGGMIAKGKTENDVGRSGKKKI